LEASTQHQPTIAFWSNQSNSATAPLLPEPGTRSKRTAYTRDWEPKPNPSTSSDSTDVNLREVALKCAYTNRLNLRNKLDELRQLAFSESPDLIVLTETWLTSGFLDGELLIPNYSICSADSLRGRTGGMTIYLKDTLTPFVLHVSLPFHWHETLWVSISLRYGDSLLIGVVYRSPSAPTDDLSLITHLRTFIKETRHSHLLLLGDFNAPKINWEKLSSSESGFSKELASLVAELSWTQHVS
jgi:hypothetical protein